MRQGFADTLVSRKMGLPCQYIIHTRLPHVHLARSPIPRFGLFRLSALPDLRHTLVPIVASHFSWSWFPDRLPRRFSQLRHGVSRWVLVAVRLQVHHGPRDYIQRIQNGKAAPDVLVAGPESETRRCHLVLTNARRRGETEPYRTGPKV
jgi:hypothetical protein